MRAAAILLLAWSGVAAAQTVVKSLSPARITAGAAAFELTIAGSGFSSGTVVQFNGQVLSTLVVSNTEMRAAVPASAVLHSGSVKVSFERFDVVVASAVDFPILPPLVFVTDAALTAAAVGTLYQQALIVTGGGSPYRFEVSKGSLPYGLSLLESGSVLGIATQEGSAVFTVTASDSAGASIQRAFTIPVVRAPAIAVTSLPRGIVGAAYTAPLQGTGGMAPYHWQADSEFPPGITFSAEGVLGGIPSLAGVFRFTAALTDGAGFRATREFNVQVVEPLRITGVAALPAARLGMQWTTTLAAAGGIAPYSWRVSAGSLPAGIGLEEASGKLSGIPVETAEDAFTVEVSDMSGQRASVPLAVRVSARLVLASSGLPAAELGSSYTAALAAAGGVAPYVWTVAGGTLPAGVSVDAGSGEISGVPATAGTFRFAVSLSDASGETASRDLTLDVKLPAAPLARLEGFALVSAAAQQVPVTLAIGAAYPVEIAGTLQLTYESAGPGDPAVQFSTGGRVAQFRIPAGGTQAVFDAPAVVVQTGTVAGRITIGAEMSALGVRLVSEERVAETVVSASAPVLTGVVTSRTASGFDVTVTGYSSTRELGRAVFQFAGGAGADLRTSELTVDVAGAAEQWFSTAESGEYGGMFVYRQSFVVQGDAVAARAVTVELSNEAGVSAAVSGGL